MVRGERAITEKTLETLAAWPELRDLFEKPPLAREESASYELAALGPTIEQAVEVIGIALAGASAEAREAVAANMAGWARAGGKEPWASVITSLLNANSGKRSARDR